MFGTDLMQTAVAWKNYLDLVLRDRDHRTAAAEDGLCVEPGDGRLDERFPFKDPTQDVRLVPERDLLGVLNAAALRYDPLALRQVALVLYPCDQHQYNPYGMRGDTLIPCQLALTPYGLKDQGRRLLLPDGFSLNDIPRSF